MSRTICSYPGCTARVTLPATRCAAHPHSQAKRARDRRYDAKRRAGQWWRGWYKLAAWTRARSRQLAAEPLCQMCLDRGVTRLASVVDHVTPHRGDWKLFVDPSNHQSLCDRCHGSDKQASERGRDILSHADLFTGGGSKPQNPIRRGPAAEALNNRNPEIEGGSKP